MPPELIESLFTLHFVRLRFYAAVGGRLDLPPLPGATLHGMLGPTLARETCTCGTLSDGYHKGRLPDLDAHRPECLFRQLYRPQIPVAMARTLGLGGGGDECDLVSPTEADTPKPERIQETKLTGAPAPHLIRPPLGQRVFQPGDRLPFEIVLVGRAGSGAISRPGETFEVPHWRRVVLAVKRGLGEIDGPQSRQGLGRSRIPCPLVEVSDGEGRTLWARDYGFVDEPAIEVPARKWVPETHGWVQVRFLTPAAVKDSCGYVDGIGRHRVLSGRDPLGVLCRAFVRRIHQVVELYCAGKGDPLVRVGDVCPVPSWIPDGLNYAKVSRPRPYRMAMEARRPVIFERIENHDIHAEIGELHASGVPEDLINLCLIAESIGIGSNTTHGLGWFEVLV